MVNIKTTLLGLIGYPIGHSYSPLLHNSTLRRLGLNYVYLAFSVKPGELADAVVGIRSLNIRGVNVTIPYKEEVISLLDKIDPLAERVGAVNTIVNDEGILKGYNTDVIGIKRMIEEDAGFMIEEKNVVIVGAGGAARAVGVAVCESGAAGITIINRTHKKAKLLADFLEKTYSNLSIGYVELSVDQYYNVIKEADLLIDTTPIGMAPEIKVSPVIEPQALHRDLLVIDLVYNPAETVLLKAARDVNASCLNGEGMLLYQGIESFKLWTGHEPEVTKWKEILKKRKNF
ncbi:shikimate dehydrogenase [Iocasia frigidifontis]|uniref:Shikimate dehydrogenase (NADP(+)) n=1 Tax=Iocasia fonsfrigidae TaxID=2682810 RepID=A0A8A7KEN3_9FIRM|nr:shikimate dehydrogenase [Iocasia fonsfrigidae]QTL98555.1 shikimate dehydrogenase [Iocasia fonsfrigidae]